MNILEAYRNRLPWHGLGTDVLKGLKYYAAIDLIKKAFVQHNPKQSVCWLVYDIDTETAAADWIDQDAPIPNIIAVNPVNGHAHLFYGLETPVYRFYDASLKALKYLAAVDTALINKLKADAGYHQLISKNPLHDRWQVVIPREELYTLEALSRGIELPWLKDKRTKIEPIGLGRNCQLFDKVRTWAYKERRKQQQYFNQDMFKAAVMWHAQQVNMSFNTPLPACEIRAVSKSVSKWTWQNMSPGGFKAWGDKRRQKSILTKKTRSAELRAEIIKAIQQCPELSQTDIADMYGINQSTISRYLNYASVISD